MNTLHDEIVTNLNWQRVQLSVEEAAEAVLDIECNILDRLQNHRVRLQNGKESTFTGPMLAITDEAWRALKSSEITMLDSDDWTRTFIFLDLPGCAVYVFDRDCFWEKEEETRHEAWDRMLAAGHETMCLIDDENSTLSPFFTAGNQWKVIEIEGWIDPPQPVMEYNINPDDLEDPPF